MPRTEESLLALDEIKLPKRVPPLSQIQESDVQTMPLAVLLAEAHSLKDAEKRLKAIKDRLKDLIHEQGHGEGVRAAGLCAVVRWSDGRKSLSKELLIENGVSPKVIDASTKTGEGYWVCELPQMEGI